MKKFLDKDFLLETAAAKRQRYEIALKKQNKGKIRSME